jgi:hypothetical protein
MHSFRKTYSKDVNDYGKYISSKKYKGVRETLGERGIVDNLADFERRFARKTKDEYETPEDNFKDSFEWELHEKEEYD